MFSKHKKLLLIVVGLVIVFFGYWYFVLSKKGDDTVIVNATGGGLVRSSDVGVTGTSTANLEIDKKFINGILSLNSVNIDIKLFETHAYRALSFPDKPFIVDYAIEAGRGNPFLPIGIDSPVEFEAGPGSGNQVVETRRATTSTSTSTATSSRASSTPPVNPRPAPSRVQ